MSGKGDRVSSGQAGLSLGDVVADWEVSRDPQAHSAGEASYYLCPNDVQVQLCMFV